MLAMDSLFFIITWTPFMVLLFDPYILPKEEFKTANAILDILLTTNYFSTPVMYYIFNNDFKVSHRLLTELKLKKQIFN